MSEPKLTRRQQAELYLQDPNMRRYLDVLSFTEGTTKNGYHTKFGGGRWEDLSKHPNIVWGKTGDGKTTATGRYQFLGSTFNEQAKKLGLKDFGPQSQDLAAVSLIMERGAVQDILNGDIDKANRKLSSTWASLPYNNSIHQSQRSAEEVAQEWERLGGKEYMIPNQQYDYSTTQPNTNTVFAPTPITAPQSIANTLTSNFAPAETSGGFTDAFNQLNNTLNPFGAVEPEMQPNKSQYQNQLAQAFGVSPDTKAGLPDYIGNLVKSIYDPA